MSVSAADAIGAARALIGTPYGTGAGELDCINLIKKVIRTAPGGVRDYTTAGTNALWQSYGMAAKYRDLTWRQEGLDGAQAGMLAFKHSGEDVHHVGLCTGEGMVIHASSAKGKTVETPLTAREGWTRLARHRYIDTEDGREESGMKAVGRMRVRVESGTLNLRRGPGVEYEAIAQLPNGALVWVLAQGAWPYVRCAGVTGYVSGEYLVEAQEDEDAQEDGERARTALVRASDGAIIVLDGDWHIAED